MNAITTIAAIGVLVWMLIAMLWMHWMECEISRLRDRVDQIEDWLSDDDDGWDDDDGEDSYDYDPQFSLDGED